MKKYIVAGLIVAAGLGAFSVSEAAVYSASFLRGSLFGIVEAKNGPHEIYKLVDGKTTCYVMGNGTAISCVK